MRPAYFIALYIRKDGSKPDQKEFSGKKDIKKRVQALFDKELHSQIVIVDCGSWGDGDVSIKEPSEL